MSNIEGLTALQKRFAAISDNRAMLQEIAKLAVKEAKDLVPRKTGNLGRTIRFGTVTETSAQILAGGAEGVGYARSIEYGAKPHIIRPRNKKALSFSSQHALNKSAGLGLVAAGSTLKYTLAGNLTAGSMRKYGNAAFTVVRSVHHPGNAAHAFLMPGAKKAVSKAGLAERIYAAWDGAA